MKKILLFPLRFYLAYILLSLMVFAFGPWPWPTRTSLELYIFMVLAVIAIFIGYRKGIRKSPGSYYGKLTYRQLYHICLYLTFILFYPTLSWRTGGNLNLSLNLLIHPAAAYLTSHGEENFTGTAWIEYIRIFFSVFLQLLIPILVVYWESLNITERVLGVFAVLLNIVLWLSVGTNKGVGDIVVVVFWALLIRYHNKINFRSFTRIILCVVPIILLFLVFFVQGQIDRNKGEGVQDTIFSLKNIQADRSSWSVRYLPPFAQEGVIAFTSYWVQGYNGLALCLNEPFIPTFGFGNSRFTATYVDKYLGSNIERTTYPARAERTYGWDSKKQWHTIFPWLASDITFIGAILVIGLFSYLFALSWSDSLYSKNPYALSTFLQFTIMFTYISANNQALQTGEGYVGFIITILSWLYTRKNIKIVW